MDNNETNVREQHSTEAQQAAAEARAKARNRLISQIAMETVDAYNKAGKERKNTFRIILHFIGTGIGVVILVLALFMVKGKFDDFTKATPYDVGNDTTFVGTEGLDSYTFGGDFFTESYNASYTINENLESMAVTNKTGFDSMSEGQQTLAYQIADVQNEIVKQREKEKRNWSILLGIIGVVMILGYLEKLAVDFRKGK